MKRAVRDLPFSIFGPIAHFRVGESTQTCVLGLACAAIFTQPNPAANNPWVASSPTRLAPNADIVGSALRRAVTPRWRS